MLCPSIREILVLCVIAEAFKNAQHFGQIWLFLNVLYKKVDLIRFDLVSRENEI